MKLAALFLALIILGSCGMSGLKLIQGGDVKQTEFFHVMSFERLGSLPIINVQVNGQPAKFLIDTGAPCVISPEMAAKLNLETALTNSVSDAAGKKEDQDLVVIDSVSVDGIVFREMAAMVIDLERVESLKCLKIDGIIGANLMRKAFWEMNYPEQKLTFTNDICKLSDRSKMSVVDFRPVASGTPMVDIRLNGYIVKNVTFDSGSTGQISLSKNDLKSIPFYEEKNKVASEVGSTHFGAFGAMESDTTYYCKIDSLSVGGGLQLPKSIVEFGNSVRIIGTKILENYTVILDWEEAKIYMREEKPYSYNSLKNFGFGMVFQNFQLNVGSLYQDTEAASLLKIGDQILSIDEDDFEKIEEDVLLSIALKKVEL